MLYDKKMLDRYPAKDEENLRGVPMIWKMAEYNLFNRLYWKQIFEYYIFSEEMRNKNIHCDSWNNKFLCYYVYSYLFQWNDNVNINYPAEYEIGDIVFTCIGAALFGQISAASNCWSNHVGIIIGHNGEDFLVAESRVPPLNHHYAIPFY